MGDTDTRDVQADGPDVTGLTGAEAAERQAFVRHQLRTPLAVMRPLLDMLLDAPADELGESQRGHLRMLDRNLDRLAAMIAGVVESGWLEVAAVPAEEAALDVGELVEAVLADVRSAVEACPRLEAGVDDGLPPVRGDALRLRRALRNVVLNAVTFTPASGSVLVSARRADGGRAVVLCVEDTGCGIAPEELPHVFEFGFQGEAARAREARGLGLGLTIARDLVEAHGGRIWLESVPHEGTRVWLELPRAA